MEKTCHWCQPDEDGKYTAAMLDNQEFNKSIAVFLCDEKITLIMQRNGMPDGNADFPINFCPMCGRQVKEGITE